MGYSARLEFTWHTEGEGVTSGLAGALSHHEGSFRLLAQYLQRYLPEITVASLIINERDLSPAGTKKAIGSRRSAASRLRRAGLDIAR